MGNLWNIESFSMAFDSLFLTRTDLERAPEARRILLKGLVFSQTY